MKSFQEIILTLQNFWAKQGCALLQFLQDSEIDFVKELGASYFKVKNPNAASNCGCGSSFSI
jgi:iron-sulfur cluster assembly accessory protein